MRYPISMAPAQLGRKSNVADPPPGGRMTPVAGTSGPIEGSGAVVGDLSVEVTPQSLDAL